MPNRRVALKSHVVRDVRIGRPELTRDPHDKMAAPYVARLFAGALA
jgi:hypothetical protein